MDISNVTTKCPAVEAYKNKEDKKMKKRLSILLVLALALTIVACKGGPAANGTGMIEVKGQDESTPPKNIKLVSDDKIQEVKTYLQEHEDEAESMTYAKLEELFGAQGADFIDLDKTASESGNKVKYIYWYSENDNFLGIFIATPDEPDKFILNIYSTKKDMENN